MRKYSNLLIIIITFMTLILVFINKSLISNTIITSLSIWFYTLIPSMMPMFIISDILINYDFVSYIPKKIIYFLSKTFNISSYGVFAFLLSIVSGFPCNAITINTLYENNKISIDEANHLLLFCNFANPLFILETVGIMYLKSNKYGIIILISNIISNIIIGIITKNKNYPTKNNYISNNNKSQNFGNVLTNSINKCINTLLSIGITVTLFLILSNLIIYIFKLNDIFSLFTKSILEMTMALSHLSNMIISNKLKVILSSIIISFSGLSIHLQIISVLNEKIKYRFYFLGRIIQSIISSFITLILLYII